MLYRCLNIAVLVFFSVVFVTAANADEEDNSEIDYIELASLMLSDNNLERAEIALSQVDLNAEGVDIQRYHIVNGLMLIRKGDNLAAKNAFLKAKSVDQVESVINVYLAQAAFALEDYTLTLQSLNDAGKAVERIPSVYYMRAQSHWLLKQYDMGIAVLKQAQRVFPNEPGFTRRIIFYYIDLGLYQQAATLGAQYLQEFQGNAQDYISIGNALRASGQTDTALSVLQLAQLKFPQHEEIIKSLAAVYISSDDFHSAAALVHQAALLNADLISEAAELYRRAGQIYMALSLNGLIEQQDDKLKQRLALLLELENYQQAAAMENDILRVQIDDDENIQYALAYALFKTGNYDSSERYLARITDSNLFKKAVELRKIMEECKNERWRCQ